MDKTQKIHISLCVNNPDNGNHTGRVEGVEFNIPGEFDAPIKLESTYWNWGPVCRREPDPDEPPSLDPTPRRLTRLRIGRGIFPFLNYATWVGNWCWDAVTVTLETANQVLAYLQSQHDRKGNPYWTIDHAWTEIFEAWEKGGTIDLGKFIEAEKEECHE